jgi:hypothetical protein
MEARYILTSEELNTDFINSVKKIFKPQSKLRIEIVEETDETDYLLSTTANKKMLEEAMNEYENGKTVSFESLDDLKKFLEN